MNIKTVRVFGDNDFAPNQPRTRVQLVSQIDRAKNQIRIARNFRDETLKVLSKELARQEYDLSILVEELDNLDRVKPRTLPCPGCATFLEPIRVYTAQHGWINGSHCPKCGPKCL